jgi:hypothetical protein
MEQFRSNCKALALEKYTPHIHTHHWSMQPCAPHSSHTSAHIMHTSYLRYSRDYLRLSEIPHLCVVVRGGVYVCVCV